MALRPRAVVIHRRTELEELVQRHATREQAEFFLRSRGRTLAQVDAGHAVVMEAHQTVLAALPSTWAVAQVERADLSRFLFAPEDVVVVVGPDGLVANVAKYLTDQLVIGVNPEPAANPGILVRHSPAEAAGLIGRLGTAGPGQVRCLALTMVEATVDDGRQLRALNEVYLGHPSHQSARYLLRCGDQSERQSSSGVIVGTGTGATGWCASIVHDRGGGQLPKPSDAALAWFVREAWPSPVTGVNLTHGWLGPQDGLTITVAADQLVAFGDGIESDGLTLGWGQDVSFRVAANRLRLAA